MFSGIVQELGRVRSADGTQISIATADLLQGAQIGDSIAVSGCCLTVASLDSGGFAADVMPETLRRTTLGGLVPGDAVNLEAALTLGDVVGGHLMAGHVDATGVVTAVRDEGTARRAVIAAPETLLQLVAPQGSIAVDGISLTVVDVDEIASSFVVSLIPHTTRITTAGAWTVGSRVNLEADVIARYVHRALQSRDEADPATGRRGARVAPRASAEQRNGEGVPTAYPEMGSASSLSGSRRRVASADGRRSRTSAHAEKK